MPDKIRRQLAISTAMLNRVQSLRSKCRVQLLQLCELGRDADIGGVGHMGPPRWRSKQR